MASEIRLTSSRVRRNGCVAWLAKLNGMWVITRSAVSSLPLARSTPMVRNATAPSCQSTVLSPLASGVTTTLAQGSVPSPASARRRRGRSTARDQTPTRTVPSSALRAWCQNRASSPPVAPDGLSYDGVGLDGRGERAGVDDRVRGADRGRVGGGVRGDLARRRRRSSSSPGRAGERGGGAGVRGADGDQVVAGDVDGADPERLGVADGGHLEGGGASGDRRARRRSRHRAGRGRSACTRRGRGGDLGRTLRLHRVRVTVEGDGGDRARVLPSSWSPLARSVYDRTRGKSSATATESCGDPMTTASAGTAVPATAGGGVAAVAGSAVPTSARTAAEAAATAPAEVNLRDMCPE